MLADLYADHASVRRLLSEANLRAQHVTFDGQAANTWFSVLEYANNTGKLKALLDIILHEYPHLIEHLSLAAVDSIASPSPTEPSIDQEDLTGERSALVSVNFLEDGLRVARSVAKIILRDGAAGTGFLIRGDLLVTCHHVISTVEEAATATIRFNYQQSLRGMPAAFHDFRPNPGAFFLTSELDDFTVVKLDGKPHERWGYLPITPRRVTVGERVNIIQHPDGEPKQMSYFHNIVAFVGMRHLEYKTDTRDGSSGSPVFDKDWNLIAIHRGSRRTTEILRSADLKRNVGIHIDLLSTALGKVGVVGLGHSGDQ